MKWPYPPALLALLAACATTPEWVQESWNETESVILQIRGREYRLLLRTDPETPQLRPLRQQVSAFPADLAEPDPTSDETFAILAELEEIAWAAKLGFAEAFDRRIVAETPRQPGANPNHLIERLYLDLAAGDAVMLPKLQTLFNRTEALELVVRALRRHYGLPEMPSGLGHFSPLPLPVGLDDRLHQAGFEPMAAYSGFRLLRAVFRAGDPALLHHAVQYPLLVVFPEGSLWVENAESLHRIAARIVQSPLRDAILRQRFSEAAITQRSIILADGGLLLVPACSVPFCNQEAMLRIVILPLVLGP